MPTAVYAPSVTVRVHSTKLNTVIDVSEDIIEGSTHLITKGVSTMDLTLLNAGRKYDEVFSPMDRFVVYLRRIRPMLIMSGYLDSVPLFSMKPQNVRLRGSSSMKLLQHTLWDPGTPAAIDLFNRRNGLNELNDGGLASRTIDLLTQVAGWEKGRIHIGGIPREWFEGISKLAQRMEDDADVSAMAMQVGSGAYINGTNPLVDTFSVIPGIGPGTGSLPDTHGRISHFGGPSGGAYGPMALTGESGTNPDDQWYCAMRWPYVTDTRDPIPGVNVGQAKEWWRNRRILVVNPRNNKAVVLRAADWGPHPSTGKVIDVSPAAEKALGLGTGETVNIAFAEESGKNATLGPVAKRKGGTTAADVQTSSATGLPHAIDKGWGRPGDTSNMRTIHVKGHSLTVHHQAADRFAGFVTDLVDRLGYKPKVIGSFNERKIAGSSTWSNHAYGAAIDIDPEKNPYYVSGEGGPYALPGPEKIIPFARKWGLGWGGEWNGSKDYMHFEVIGAPASGDYETVEIAGPSATYWTPPVKEPYTVTARFKDGGARWTGNTHSGTDFAKGAGSPIYPVGPGTVLNKGFDADAYGHWVSIDHGQKVFTFYAHMEEASPVALGTAVTPSDSIGSVGSTGNSSGPHVHVELRLDEDTYSAALKSGGIEKYIIGHAPPPRGVAGVTYSQDGSTQSATDMSNIGGGLLNVWQWFSSVQDVNSMVLTGYRALMNDVPILRTIEEYMTASFREYTAAPNGDFIAWYPDYFGHYKTAGKMIVTPLEIDGVGSPPEIRWSDQGLITHQFAVGSMVGYQDTTGSIEALMGTQGIASVEFPELLEALLNVDAEEAKAISETALKRYGPRVNKTSLSNISGARQEFYFACMKFMENWTQQFQTTLNVIFMPEIYPGMLACFPTYGIQGYVREVTHTFNFRQGGGFRTSISAAPWSTIGDKGPGTLPRGAPL